MSELASELGVSEQTIYTWCDQDRIDRGEAPGQTSSESAELASARRRILELETQLAVHQRATELLTQSTRFAAAQVIAAGGFPVSVVCKILGVSVSGYYDWRGRSKSRRAIRHAWLTELIRDVHLQSRGTDGARRVHAQLELGRGVNVHHETVALLMRRARL